MYVGMGMLFFMMFLGGADVIGRYFLNHPIVGSFEITEILLAGIVFFGLAYTQRVKGHAMVDIVYARLPKKPKTFIGLVNSFVLLCLFLLILWRGLLKALTQLRMHREIPNLGWPYFPFQLFVPLGALIMCLALIVEILRFFDKPGEDD